MITRYDLNRIKARWTAEKKISAADVAGLLDAADRAITMASARSLNDAGKSSNSDLWDRFFGGGLR